MKQMNKATKDELFNEIIRNNPSNNFVYNQLLQTMIYNRNQIVPFIGAGVSLFAFSTWGGLLQNLLAQTDQVVTDQANDSKLKKINELIEAGNYFQAADELEGIIDSDVFYFSLTSAFSESCFVKDGKPFFPEDAAVRFGDRKIRVHPEKGAG